jgi:hypothetical protein
MALFDVDVIAAALVDKSLWLLTPRELIEVAVERRSDSARIVERRRIKLSGPPASTPARTPFGVVTASPSSSAGRLIRAHSGGFADGVTVGAAGRAEPLRGWPLPGLDGVCEPQGEVFVAERCTQVTEPLPERFVALSSLTRADGSHVTAALTPGTASTLPSLVVRVAAGAAWETASGSAIAIGVTARGEIVAHSEPALPGLADAVTVRQVAPGLPSLTRIEHGGAVRAVVIGDLDGTVAVWAISRDLKTGRSELWRVD